MTTVVVTLSFFLLFLHGAEAGIGFGTGSSFCEDGWLLMSNGLCVLPVTQPKSWSEARDFCYSKVARLYNPTGNSSLAGSKEVKEYLGSRLLPDSEYWWTGMYIDQSMDRLMWDDYGPSFIVKRSRDQQNDWTWEESEPASGSGSCGKLRLGIQEISTTTVGPFDDTGSGDGSGLPPPDFSPSGNISPNVKQFNNRLYMRLQKCAAEYPFVCQKAQVSTSFSPVSTCDKGWVGNVYMTTCFRIPRENASYTVAQGLCSSQGGSLVSLDTNFALLREIVNYYTSKDPYFNATGISTLWLETLFNNNREVPEQPCTLYVNGDGTSRPCTFETNYMCQKNALSPKHQLADVKVSSVYLNQEVLATIPTLLAYPIIGTFDRPPSETEIIVVRTPSGFVSSKYVSKVARFSTSLSPMTSTPFFVNVTMNAEIPSRRRRALSMARQPFLKYVREAILRRKKRQSPDSSIYVSDDDLVDNAGYYQFSYYNLIEPLAVSSDPVLIRFSEKYLLVYVAYLTAPLAEFYITPRDIEAKNLLDDESYTSMIQEFLGGVIFGRPNAAPWIQTYRNKIEHMNATTNIIKARYFITYGRENITEQEEQEMLMIMKDHFSTSSQGLISSNVLSTVACPTFEVNNVTFTFARIGETRFSWERCFGATGARAHAKCEGNYDDGARWGEVVYRSGCSDPPTPNDTSSSTKDLERLSESTVETDNYGSILNNTVILTSPDVNLTRDDVIFTADILYNQWQAQKDVTPVIDDIFSITNNVLFVSEEVIDEANAVDNAANRIIRSTEELATRVMPPNMRNLRVVKSFVAAEIWEQTGSETDYTIGITLTTTQSAEKYEIQSENLNSVEEAGEVVVNNTDAAIYLRRGLVANAKTKLAFQLYGKTSLFSAKNDRYRINSKVAAAKLFIDGVETFDLDDGDVTAVFNPIEDVDDIVCGFWNYSANQDAGGWSISGCKTSRDGQQIVCKCNHLTNFAVLIDLEAHLISDLDKKILDIITTVGLVVSIICLGLTILTFILFKHLRSGRGHQVLINLSVAIVCSAIIFLVGIERIESRTGCKVVAALLHYFILVSFMWMLVEGVLQYLRFVKVLGTYIPKFMMKTMIPAWGLPLIPVIVVLAIDHELMYTGEKGYCWLQYDAMLYAFLIPVAVVIAANIVVFLMVMCKLMRRKNKGITNQSEKKMAFLHFQAGVSIFFILGLTWVFGFLAMTKAQIVFHYLFAIFNAFQGLFIFLLFTLKEKKIRTAWRKMCCGRKSAYRDTSGTDNHQKKVHSGTTDSTGYSNSGNGHRKGSSGSQDSALIASNPNFRSER